MIRNATQDDVLELIEIGKLMHGETSYKHFDFDEEKVAELLVALITNARGIAIVSEGEDGELQGGLIGAVSPMWFGTDLQATDYALFLKKEFRGAKTGIPLLHEYEKQAKEKGAKQVLIATTAGYKPKDMAKLYEAAGFTQIGFIHSITV